MKPKFCVDCKHHFSSVLHDGEEYHWCYARHKDDLDLVTGKPKGNDSCSWMRAAASRCGTYASLFEPKDL